MKLIFQHANLFFQHANPGFQRVNSDFPCANLGFQRANPGFQRANPVYRHAAPTFQPVKPTVNAMHSGQASSLCGERHLAKLRRPIINLTENSEVWSPSRGERGEVIIRATCAQQHAEIANKGATSRTFRTVRAALLTQEARYADKIEERGAIRAALPPDCPDGAVDTRMAIDPADSV
ncbi:hypothetical protein EWM64_g2376 [Hericium alpestre]|uniref:Uncharacterized protein n=1 Tax=Hericium alpestre TaxID=135208 RepID=A0A4Z0A4J9_9AGAM|nr:hypothetical protein EWM64_g2376 [Hericium alpestre]